MKVKTKNGTFEIKNRRKMRKIEISDRLYDAIEFIKTLIELLVLSGEYKYGEKELDDNMLIKVLIDFFNEKDNEEKNILDIKLYSRK